MLTNPHRRHARRLFLVGDNFGFKVLVVACGYAGWLIWSIGMSQTTGGPLNSLWRARTVLLKVVRRFRSQVSLILLYIPFTLCKGSVKENQGNDQILDGFWPKIKVLRLIFNSGKIYGKLVPKYCFSGEKQPGGVKIAKVTCGMCKN